MTFLATCALIGLLPTQLREMGAFPEIKTLGSSPLQTASSRFESSTAVFRNSAFADGVAKTNLTAILQQHGLQNVRSL